MAWLGQFWTQTIHPMHRSGNVGSTTHSVQICLGCLLSGYVQKRAVGQFCKHLPQFKGSLHFSLSILMAYNHNPPFYQLSNRLSLLRFVKYINFSNGNLNSFIEANNYKTFVRWLGLKSPSLLILFVILRCRGQRLGSSAQEAERKIFPAAVN